MVLTPKFHLTQTAEHILVHVNVPNVRVMGMELTVVNQGRNFCFYCRPYLLRIDLPGPVIDEDYADETKRPRAVYNPDKDRGTLTIYLSKQEQGQHFDGLDMISSLLKAGAAKPRLGTGRYGLGVDSQGTYGFLNGFKNFFGSDGFLEEFPELVDVPDPDDSTPQSRTLLRQAHEDAIFSGERYRIDLYCGKDDRLYVSAWIFDPEWAKARRKDNKGRPSHAQNRISAKKGSKAQRVSVSSLKADTPKAKGSDATNDLSKSFTGLNVSSDVITPAKGDGETPFIFGSPQSFASSLNAPIVFGSPSGESVRSANESAFSFQSKANGFPSPFATGSASKPSFTPDASSNDSPFVFGEMPKPSTDAPFFTEKERIRLSQMPKRDFEINSADALLRAQLKLLDVLLAYCYEHRFLEGEFNVESHWMIRKLSAALSWLEEFEDINQVFSSFARRCLCFPFLRRWDLCCRAAMDCASLLDDSRYVLRALLQVQALFNESQSAYLLNKLFIDDMCLFVQQDKHEWMNVPLVQQAIASTFTLEITVPSPSLIEWDLTVASSEDDVDEETLKVSHLKGLTRAQVKHPNIIEDID